MAGSPAAWSAGSPNTTIRLQTQRASIGEPSTITISNVAVLTGQLVLEGVRNIQVGGPAVVDATGTGASAPRWGSANTINAPYVNVVRVLPEDVVEVTGNEIGVSWTAGPNFTVNGVTTPFGAGLASINLTASASVVSMGQTITVPYSTLFVPFRAVVAALTDTAGEALPGDSVIDFFQGSGGNPHSIMLTFGDNVAQFVVGQSTFVLNGLTLPMTNPTTGAAVYTFIGDGTVGAANVTYLPLRFIAAALGFDIADGVGQSIVSPR